MRPDTEWRTPAGDLRLGPKHVHIWRVGVEVDDSELTRLRASLTEDEQQRAARFQFPALRRRFSAARGILRELLGSYLQLSPDRLRFVANRHGKPYLTPECSAELRFNLSHSGDMAMIAIATAREVGIDIEQIRPVPSGDQIAERFFTPAEAGRIRSLPAEQRAQAFFDCWVRKEAFVKATGQGVSFGLDRFEMPVAPGDSSAMLLSFRCPPDVQDWSLLPLEPCPGYVGAAVAAGTDWVPVLWHWQPGGSVGRQKE
jgi:4'-phosphopantetheinyl transferase